MRTQAGNALRHHSYSCTARLDAQGLDQLHSPPVLALFLCITPRITGKKKQCAQRAALAAVRGLATVGT